MVAPIIAGILATLAKNGLETVAEVVKQKGTAYVEEKLGVQLKPEMTQEDILKVKEAAMKHEEFKIIEDNKNTADARDMQKVALQQDDKFSKRFVYIFAAAWSIFAMIFIFAITFGQVPPDSIRFADTILGFLLGTIIATILNFFFGSSNGSLRKTDMLVELEKQRLGK